MRQTTAVDSSWQQGQEEGEEGVLLVWLCGGGVAPPIQDMRSAVVWPCVMCVHCGVVDAVFIVGCVEGFRWTSGGQLIRQ